MPIDKRETPNPNQKSTSFSDPFNFSSLSTAELEKETKKFIKQAAESASDTKEDADFLVNDTIKDFQKEGFENTDTGKEKHQNVNSARKHLKEQEQLLQANQKEKTPKTRYADELHALRKKEQELNSKKNKLTNELYNAQERLNIKTQTTKEAQEALQTQLNDNIDNFSKAVGKNEKILEDAHKKVQDINQDIKKKTRQLEGTKERLDDLESKIPDFNDLHEKTIEIFEARAKNPLVLYDEAFEEDIDSNPDIFDDHTRESLLKQKDTTMSLFPRPSDLNDNDWNKYFSQYAQLTAKFNKLIKRGWKPFDKMEKEGEEETGRANNLASEIDSLKKDLSNAQNEREEADKYYQKSIKNYKESPESQEGREAIKTYKELWEDFKQDQQNEKENVSKIQSQQEQLNEELSEIPLKREELNAKNIEAQTQQWEAHQTRQAEIKEKIEGAKQDVKEAQKEYDQSLVDYSKDQPEGYRKPWEEYLKNSIEELKMRERVEQALLKNYEFKQSIKKSIRDGDFVNLSSQEFRQQLLNITDNNVVIKAASDEYVETIKEMLALNVIKEPFLEERIGDHIEKSFFIPIDDKNWNEWVTKNLLRRNNDNKYSDKAFEKIIKETFEGFESIFHRAYEDEQTQPQANWFFKKFNYIDYIGNLEDMILKHSDSNDPQHKNTINYDAILNYLDKQIDHHAEEDPNTPEQATEDTKAKDVSVDEFKNADSLELAEQLSSFTDKLRELWPAMTQEDEEQPALYNAELNNKSVNSSGNSSLNSGLIRRYLGTLRILQTYTFTKQLLNNAKKNYSSCTFGTPKFRAVNFRYYTDSRPMPSAKQLSIIIPITLNSNKQIHMLIFDSLYVPTSGALRVGFSQEEEKIGDDKIVNKAATNILNESKRKTHSMPGLTIKQRPWVKQLISAVHNGYPYVFPPATTNLLNLGTNVWFKTPGSSDSVEDLLDKVITNPNNKDLFLDPKH